MKRIFFIWHLQHALGLCSVIVLKMLLSILYFIAINSAVTKNSQAMMRLFEENMEEDIRLAEREVLKLFL